MVRSTYLALMALTVLAIIFTVSCDSLDQDRIDLIDPIKQKRPFCNAFTGCGRKRSNRRDSADFSNISRQNKLYALLQQRMAEIEALRGIMEEVNGENVKSKK